MLSIDIALLNLKKCGSREYPEKMTESIKRFKNKNKRMKEDVNHLTSAPSTTDKK